MAVRIISAPDAWWVLASGWRPVQHSGVGKAIKPAVQPDRAYLDAFWRARAVDWREHHRAMAGSLEAITRSREMLAKSERMIRDHEMWWRGG